MVRLTDSKDTDFGKYSLLTHSTTSFVSIFLFLFPVNWKQLRGFSISVLWLAVQLFVTKETSNAES